MNDSLHIGAGDFDLWLNDILLSFKSSKAVDVPCGDCRGCCSAGRFIHVIPSDRAALSVIPKQFLQIAPGMQSGHAVMGYLENGLCPMLKEGNCGIYLDRPSTCRSFDCRVLAAADLRIEGKWNARINERVEVWKFSFSTPESEAKFKAIKRAAHFIKHNAAAFPGGRAPSEPLTVAVLAIKVHSVFLTLDKATPPPEIANAIIAESRRFEAS